MNKESYFTPVAYQWAQNVEFEVPASPLKTQLLTVMALLEVPIIVTKRP